jgi:hypothetical protein
MHRGKMGADASGWKDGAKAKMAREKAWLDSLRREKTCLDSLCALQPLLHSLRASRSERKIGSRKNKMARENLGLENLDREVAHACTVCRVEQKVKRVFNDGSDFAMHIDISWQHLAVSYTLQM